MNKGVQTLTSSCDNLLKYQMLYKYLLNTRLSFQNSLHVKEGRAREVGNVTGAKLGGNLEKEVF